MAVTRGPSRKSLLFSDSTNMSDSQELWSNQELSQEDSITQIVASSPPGAWGIFLSDCLTHRIDLRAPKAVIGRQQENNIEDGVQYIRLGGTKTSRWPLRNIKSRYLIIIVLV